MMMFTFLNPQLQIILYNSVQSFSFTVFINLPPIYIMIIKFYREIYKSEGDQWFIKNFNITKKKGKLAGIFSFCRLPLLNAIIDSTVIVFCTYFIFYIGQSPYGISYT